MKKEEVLIYGPKGKILSWKEALEQKLEREMWALEHVQPSFKKPILERCQQLIKWIEKEEKKGRKK